MVWGSGNPKFEARLQRSPDTLVTSSLRWWKVPQIIPELGTSEGVFMGLGVNGLGFRLQKQLGGASSQWSFASSSGPGDAHGGLRSSLRAQCIETSSSLKRFANMSMA